MDITIAVPHIDTPVLLYGCVASIDRYTREDLSTEILIVDQSSEPVYQAIRARYAGRDDVRVLRAPQIDAGYPLDVALRNCRGEFFCSLDCDAFPIHRNWLHVPIEIIRRGHAAWVGSHTGLDQSYASRGVFFHLNNYFRVCRTDLAFRVSEAVGFLRPGNRGRVNFTPKDDLWGTFPCDNGVAVQWYSDQKGLGSKLSLPITRCLGTTPEMGIFGMIIDDLVFHLVFGFGEEWIRDMTKTLGPDYLEVRRRLIEQEASPEAIAALVERCVSHPEGRVLDGKNAPVEIDELVEQLKRDP